MIPLVSPRKALCSALLTSKFFDLLSLGLRLPVPSQALFLQGLSEVSVPPGPSLLATNWPEWWRQLPPSHGRCPAPSPPCAKAPTRSHPVLSASGCLTGPETQPGAWVPPSPFQNFPPGLPPILLPPLDPSTTHLCVLPSLLNPPLASPPQFCFSNPPLVGGSVVTTVIVRQCKFDPIISLTQKESLQCYKIKLESPAKFWSRPFLILASFFCYPPPPPPNTPCSGSPRTKTWV